MAMGKETERTENARLLLTFQENEISAEPQRVPSTAEPSWYILVFHLTMKIRKCDFTAVLSIASCRIFLPFSSLGRLADLPLKV